MSIGGNFKSLLSRGHRTAREARCARLRFSGQRFCAGLAIAWVSSPYAAVALNFKIVNGAPVATAKSSVVEVIERTGATSGELCSGTLIAPKVVLTAWHCASRSSGRNAARIAVRIGKTFQKVSRVRLHPEARVTKDGLILNDLALLFLAKRTSYPTSAILTSRSVSVGDSLDIFGYGYDEHRKLGRLREGMTVVSQNIQTHLVTVFDGATSDACQGDSGGPAFGSYIDDSGGTRRGVVAVMSANQKDDCSVGDQNALVNLQSPAALSFLQKYAPAAVFD